MSSMWTARETATDDIHVNLSYNNACRYRTMVIQCTSERLIRASLTAHYHTDHAVLAAVMDKDGTFDIPLAF